MATAPARFTRPIRSDAYRQIGVYAGRILRGAKPEAGCVAAQVELVINLKAAKALQLTIQPWLIARTNEVIE